MKPSSQPALRDNLPTSSVIAMISMYIIFSLLVQIVKNLILSMIYLCETLNIRKLILINFREDITIKTTV